jgi:hypothetical protein
MRTHGWIGWVLVGVVLTHGVASAQDGQAPQAPQAPASEGESTSETETASEADASASTTHATAALAVPGPSPSPSPDVAGEGTGTSSPSPAPAPTTPTTPAPTTPAPTTPAPTTPAPTTPAASTQAVQFSAEAGRGVTMTVGDAFSLNLRARLQLRDTVHIPSSVPNSGEVTNELGIRTARIWLQGNLIDSHIRYGIQLALGANDFEPNNPSPIFDAFLDVTYLRDLSVRVGQFFVPFDRARTIREFALEGVDRANVVRELSLDRDVGLVLFSNDFLGLNGVLAYQVGIFGGDGRNRIGTQRFGFLYTGRVTVRPMGPFDDDAEGDLTRSASPHLAIGVGVAYNQATDRPRSTTSSPTTQFYTLGGFDYFHLAADVVFKYQGFSFLGEVLYRSANADSRVSAPSSTGIITTELSRQAWGYLAQAGMMLGPMFEIWARYEDMYAVSRADPLLNATIASSGRATAGGVNCYLNGHLFKIQLDWQHTFGNDYTRGEHLVRAQLDVTF